MSENINSNFAEIGNVETIQQPEKLTEEELQTEDQPIKKILVRHVYCPICRRELISNFPAMFNPFTQEKQCVHKCSCGKIYNLEYSYPRIVFYDDYDDEVFAHCE